MFTGIIECMGTIAEVITIDDNKTFWVYSPIINDLKVDQSLSHNGICLTIEELRPDAHKITAIAETLKKTTIPNWQVGQCLNLERCLPLGGRLDGHLVQGHVDTTGTCTKRIEKNGSWEFTFRYPGKFASLIIEKGSICVNGISLTAFNVTDKKFTVAIIPYTYEHTNMKTLQVNDKVNLEFDMIGKYVVRGKNR